jgi:hypothetical protein
MGGILQGQQILPHTGRKDDITHGGHLVIKRARPLHRAVAAIIFQ